MTLPALPVLPVPPAACSPPFSLPRFKDGPAVALEPSHRYGEWEFLGGVRQLAGPGGLGQGGVGVACTVPSTPDFPWVLLQMTRLGPGPPSPPLSGSSCPSTKLRSAAERRRAADPSLRQCPVPTGGGPLPLALAQPQRACVPLPLLVLWLWVLGIFLSFLGPICLSGTCLPVGQALGFRGVGAWLSLYPHLSPPALPPISSAYLAPLCLVTS